MADKLRVGILGAGWAGEGHINAFARLEGVEVTALWSRTRRRAEGLAGSSGLPHLQIYDHWQDLIERSEVDVISLATPPMLRLEPFAMAIERGCHVLVEKPFSLGLAGANAMVDLARGRDLVTATCFNWRYAPGNQTAWRELQTNRIGKLLDVHAVWLFTMLARGDFARRPWTTRLDLGDGLLGEGASHDFDKVRFLTGSEFEAIVSRLKPYSIAQDAGFTFEDGAQIHVSEMSNGLLGNFRLGCTAGRGEWSLRINGDAGSMFVTNESVTYQTAGDSAPVEIEICTHDQIPADVNPMQHTWNRLIADFVHAIRAGDVAHVSIPHLPTLEDGLRIQEVIVAALRSQDGRRWVNMAELE